MNDQDLDYVMFSIGFCLLGLAVFFAAYGEYPMTIFTGLTGLLGIVPVVVRAGFNKVEVKEPY